MTTIDSGLLTVKEVATALRVAPMTVYRLCDTGDLPHLRIGRSYRIRASDLDEYLQNAIGSTRAERGR